MWGVRVSRGRGGGWRHSRAGFWPPHAKRPGAGGGGTGRGRPAGLTLSLGWAQGRQAPFRSR